MANDLLRDSGKHARVEPTKGTDPPVDDRFALAPTSPHRPRSYHARHGFRDYGLIRSLSSSLCFRHFWGNVASGECSISDSFRFKRLQRGRPLMRRIKIPLFEDGDCAPWQRANVASILTACGLHERAALPSLRSSGWSGDKAGTSHYLEGALYCFVRIRGGRATLTVGSLRRRLGKSARRYCCEHSLDLWVHLVGNC
ncbi:hypothetical protein Nepgr_033965 [Nepenthes gracilis]|uniref:Uncharacterized protein n=1 Tax=Nepenthes gracilis TaxID=150966 RepID=A0AAD3TMV4_NEPGR|nr:hypothetical protein Nepgr_033965 [Nepenthes gracilis]